MSDMRDLYEEMILDHNRHPRNFEKKPEGTNRSAHGFNSLCGDDFHVYLVVEDGIVKDAGFDGCGCAISTASTSLMTEFVIGKSEEEVEAMFNDVHSMMTDPDGSNLPDVGKLEILKGVREYPMRVKCATLAWHTMHAALEEDTGMISTE